MQITRYTDYSLRVLLYLGLRKDEQVTIQEIADSYQISKNHLMKIVQELNVQGYVLAVRGKNGGLKLNQEPKDINVGKLVRLMEKDTNLVECFSEKNTCAITPHCQLKHVFSEALNAFYQTLETYTLEDLLGEKNVEGLISILLRE
jgi:Rrf2 family nitric oxide-sensitive transcriptional repressor|tara:strand:+ start:232 stop:669 length:438 start_codon:yes stop_codon:yes gene_type:complete